MSWRCYIGVNQSHKWTRSLSRPNSGLRVYRTYLPTASTNYLPTHKRGCYSGWSFSPHQWWKCVHRWSVSNRIWSECWNQHGVVPATWSLYLRGRKLQSSSRIWKSGSCLAVAVDWPSLRSEMTLDSDCWIRPRQKIHSKGCCSAPIEASFRWGATC